MESEAQDVPVAESESEAEHEEEFNLSEAYSYGNMQKNLPSGNFMDYGDQILFTEYANGGFDLYTFDKLSGEVSLFCKDATCMHNSEECVSAGVDSNLEQYNGIIYAKSNNNQIMELKNGQFERIVDGAVSNFWHADNKLYAVSRDSSLVVFENDSKKSRILMDEYTSYWNVVFDGYLYGYSAKGVSRVDLSVENPQEEIIVQNGYSIIDGEHIYYKDDKTGYLYRCEMDGSNPVQMTEQPILPATINFDEEYLYFRLYDGNLTGQDSHDLYRLKKEDGAVMEKIAEFPYYVYTIYTVPGYDRIFVQTREAFVQDDTPYTYAVAKDGSSMELLELPEF